MSEKYHVKISPSALRVLSVGPPRGVPLSAAWAIYEFIDGPLSRDPWRVSKPLHNELEGWRGSRRGEYRVVLRIDETTQTINVDRVDHRADIYRT